MVSEDRCEIGHVYHQASYTLHTSHPGHDDVVTLFLEERSALREFADVYSLRYPERDIVLQAPSLLPDEYLEILEQLVLLVER